MNDPRLDCAILQPIEADGDHFLAYYLTKEEGAELEFKQGRTIAREQGDVPDGDELIATYFHVVLDYEMVKVEKRRERGAERVLARARLGHGRVRDGRLWRGTAAQGHVLLQEYRAQNAAKEEACQRACCLPLPFSSFVLFDTLC